MLQLAYRWLLCVLMIAAHSCLKYSDGFCNKIVTFELLASTNTTAIDLKAEDLYSDVPRWVSEDCLLSAWELSCMLAYIGYASDQEGYCYSDCSATVTNCSQTAYSFNTTVLGTNCSSVSTRSSACHSEGSVTFSDIPQGWSTICPVPLKIPSKSSKGVVHRIEGTACSYPCPSLVYTDEEWKLARDIVRWCSLVGGACAAAVIFSHLEAKHSLLRLLCGLATFSTWTMFTFLSVDENHSQTCADDSHFYVREPLCVFQAFVILFCIMWMSGIKVIISFQLWARLVLKIDNMTLNTYQRNGVKIAGLLSLTGVSVALGVQNLGYDFEGNSGPVCFYLVSETTIYYWVLFFSPAMLLVCISSVLMIQSIVFVNIHTLGAEIRRSRWLKFVGCLTLNRRMVYFAVYFNVFSLLVGVLLLYNGSKAKPGAIAAYADCLLQNTYDNPDSGIAVCGQHPSPRTPLGRALPVLVYMSSIGVVVLVVYGLQNKGWILLREALFAALKWLSELKTP